MIRTFAAAVFALLLTPPTACNAATDDTPNNLDLKAAYCLTSLQAMSDALKQPAQNNPTDDPKLTRGSADSDEVARAIRDDVARDYEMISPGFGASLA
jgi:hypothetical protein